MAQSAQADGQPYRIRPGALTVGGTTCPSTRREGHPAVPRPDARRTRQRAPRRSVQSEVADRGRERSSTLSEFFKDKYVFFGVTRPGLYDLKPTPMSGSYPGVEVQRDDARQPPLRRISCAPCPLVPTLRCSSCLCLGAGIAISSVQRAQGGAPRVRGFHSRGPRAGHRGVRAGLLAADGRPGAGRRVFPRRARASPATPRKAGRSATSRAPSAST